MSLSENIMLVQVHQKLSGIFQVFQHLEIKLVPIRIHAPLFAGSDLFFKDGTATPIQTPRITRSIAPP